MGRDKGMLENSKILGEVVATWRQEKSITYELLDKEEILNA